MYLVIGLVLFLRKIVGGQVADLMMRSLVIDALRMAVRLQGHPKGATLHSDQGTQYTSGNFLDFVETMGMPPAVFEQSINKDEFQSINCSPCWSGKGRR